MDNNSLLELFKTPYWYISVARNSTYKDIKEKIINLTSFLPNNVSLTRRAWHIKNNGFVLDKALPPDYYWCKGNRLWHKFNWRHTSGLSKLENYDKTLSENDNMRLHNFHKIWDCGKLRFVKN
jgi:hypothetical protein